MTFNYGDPVASATIGWHEGNWHWKVAAAVSIPAGAYQPGELANLAFNRWIGDLSAGFTVPDPALDFSVVGGFTVNGENPDTGLHIMPPAATENRNGAKGAVFRNEASCRTQNRRVVTVLEQETGIEGPVAAPPRSPPRSPAAVLEGTGETFEELAAARSSDGPAARSGLAGTACERAEPEPDDGNRRRRPVDAAQEAMAWVRKQSEEEINELTRRWRPRAPR